MHYQLDQATSLSSQLTLDSCANAADRVLNYDSVKRPASQEMSGAEYGSPCVRHRETTWKGNTQAVRGANLPFLPIKMTRAVFTFLKLSKLFITSKSHRNIKYSK